MTGPGDKISQRSSVELLPDRVVKHFNDPTHFRRELLVYQKNLAVTPKLLEYDTPRTIVLERLDAIPYLDVQPRFPAQLLAEAIAVLHGSETDSERCFCHIDNQPKNILMSHNRCYLIDFADSKLDLPETDLTHLMLFWAEIYSPEIMAEICIAFLKYYIGPVKLQAPRWEHCLKSSIRRFDKRRRKFRPSHVCANSAQTEQNRVFLHRIAAML